MKRILILSCSILFLWSCSKDEFPLDDADYKIKLSEQISLVANSMIQDAVNKDGMLDPDAVADEIEKIDGVKTATVTPSRTTIHIKQENGGELTLLLVTMDDERMFIEEPKKSLSTSFVGTVFSNSNYITPNGTGKALILAPFQSFFQEALDSYKKWLENAGYKVDIYINEAATLDQFRGSFLDDYDVVYISSHGGPTYMDGMEINCIMTGEIINDTRDESLYNEAVKKYVIYEIAPNRVSKPRYCISPEWLRRTSGNKFPNSWIFLNACYSAYDEVELSLGEVFLELGAVGFNGWRYSPSVLWAGTVGARMLNLFTQGYSFKDASDLVRNNSVTGILNLRMPIKKIDISTFINLQNPDLKDPFYLVPPCIDYEGNVYRTVKIGNQWWMAENLAYLPTVGPYNVQSATNPMYYVYDYLGTNVNAAKLTTNYKTYGVLYNWTAAMKACPTGWHLPSEVDWETLEITLGIAPDVAASNISRRGTNEGGKLKEKGFTHWAQPNSSATDEYGFRALPAAARYHAGWEEGQTNFEDLHIITYFWSSTDKTDLANYVYGPLIRCLASEAPFIMKYGDYKESGFSVRCVKD